MTPHSSRSTGVEGYINLIFGFTGCRNQISFSTFDAVLPPHMPSVAVYPRRYTILLHKYKLYVYTYVPLMHDASVIA